MQKIKKFEAHLQFDEPLKFDESSVIWNTRKPRDQEISTQHLFKEIRF